MFSNLYNWFFCFERFANGIESLTLSPKKLRLIAIYWKISSTFLSRLLRCHTTLISQCLEIPGVVLQETSKTTHNFVIKGDTCCWHFRANRPSTSSRSIIAPLYMYMLQVSRWRKLYSECAGDDPAEKGLSKYRWVIANLYQREKFYMEFGAD